MAVKVTIALLPLVVIATGSTGAVLSYEELLAAAVEKYEQGDIVGAEELLGRILVENPDDRAANYNLGRILSERGLAEAALSCYLIAVESPQFSDALFDVAYLSYELGDRTGALEYYDRYLAYRPRDSAALYNKGIIYNDLGDNGSALACFKQAVEADPYNTGALYNLALTYYNGGQYEKALHYFDRVLGLDEGDADSWYGRGLALYALSEYDEAVRAFKRGAGLVPSDGRFYYQLGRIYYSFNELDETLAAFAQAYNLGYAQDESAYFLGQIYRDLHMYRLALEYFGRAAQSPLYIGAHVEAARIYRTMGKYAKALDELTKASEKGYADEAVLFFEFGMAYAALGLHEKAAEYFRKAVEVDPGFLEAHFYLSEAYEHFDRRRALDQWERYVGLAEGQPGEKHSLKKAKSRISTLRKEIRGE